MTLIILELLLVLLAIVPARALSQEGLATAELLAGPIVDGQILVEIGVGWYFFEFQGDGTVAPAVMLVEEGQDIIMQLTDLQCPGDEFQILKDDLVFANSTALNPTSDYSMCTIFDNNPDQTYQSGNHTWSTFTAFLQSGTHAYTFRASKSPFSSGFAAVRFDKGRTPPDPRLPFQSS